MGDISKRTPLEAEHEAARWFVDALAPRIDALQRRWEGPYQDVERGSSLAGDDAHSKPFHVSHAAWLAIAHAIDNLYALRVLTVQGEGNDFGVTTRPYAAYPLLRAAVESQFRRLRASRRIR
jgi:hypothetical protein